MGTSTRSLRFNPAWARRSASNALSSTRQAITMMLLVARAFSGDLVSRPSDSERIMTSHARTFRFASRFLPSEYRVPTMDLYAFFRTLDDLVDESAPDEHTRDGIRVELSEWAVWFSSECTGTAPRRELGDAVGPICQRYRIPNSLFIDFLDGLRADLDPQTPACRADVERYSYQVASTVGIAMAHIFQTTDSPAIEAASRLGLAMQMTNILRDVGGDVDRGRVYLPADLLEAHHLTPADVVAMHQAGGGPDHRLCVVIRTMAGWANEHYAAGIAGVQLLPRDVQMPILISARLYQQILVELEQNRFDSLRMRASTNRWQKIREAYRSALQVDHIGEAGNADLRQENDEHAERARILTAARGGSDTYAR